MRLEFLLLLIYWCASASAQQCVSSREFAVDNCTACPTIDRTRGNIQMAVCEERAANKSFACVCGNFPAKYWTPVLRYYPHVKGNVKVCANWWETAPHVHTAVAVPCVGVLLYAAAHFFYIVARSEMCSRNHRVRKFTKLNVAAFAGGTLNLCWLAVVLILIGAGNISGNSGDHYARLNLIVDVLACCWLICSCLSLVLFYVSIVDTVYPGEDTACMRRSISLSFWIPIIGCMLFYLVMFVSIHSDLSIAPTALIVPSVLLTILAMYAGVFMAIAHRKMLKIVRKHSASATKEPLIVKMNQLCVAIYRFYYGALALQGYLLFFVLAISASPCLLGGPSPTITWMLESHMYTILGFSGILFACILEGKPVPTFPMCLCRSRSGQQSKAKPDRMLSGLQLSFTLGNALTLLTKHGLDNQARQDSPVEAAMESLLSTSPLMIAATRDMDLLDCIDYFLDHCVDDEGQIAKRFVEMSVGRLLRGGCNQHTIGPGDMPALRWKAEKCLEWAQDPARSVIHNTTFDEAAAIMLYTQHTCLYPLLNGTLRDHTHPEHLKAFLPYLKLFLTGLNKLPLVRAKVYRGVSGDHHEVYNQLRGKVFRWWAFSSTTPRESQAEAFLGDGDRTLFSMDAIGVDISAFSAFPSEKEVLLLPGTRLTVQPGVMVEPNYWKFEAASVLDAAQQLQPDQLQQHSEAKIENVGEARPDSDDSVAASGVTPRGDSVTTSGDDIRVSVPRFQDTDLPHPGWEETVFNVLPETDPRPRTHNDSPRTPNHIPRTPNHTSRSTDTS